MDVLLEPSSIAGLTGINMPVGFSKEGMPIGMQIIGPQYGEETVLNLAYQYEMATDWRNEKPKI
jgi:aspartyl-tRNA(Asn)/glutamyl-tRNA(Gln) amidotransferase subunit A